MTAVQAPIEPESIPRAEQETTITWMRDDSTVLIHTSNRPHLTRLRKLSSTQDFVTEVAGGTTWGEFLVDAEFFHLFSAIRGKRALSEATRARLAEQLNARRAERGS